jgi:hypothetical protein
LNNTVALIMSEPLAKTSPLTAAYIAWYTLPLRLIVGFGFMEHGYAKLARGPDAFTHVLQALGVPMPELLAWATIAVELAGVRPSCSVHSFRLRASPWQLFCSSRS